MTQIRIINKTSLPVSTWTDFSVENPDDFGEQLHVIEKFGEKRKFQAVKGIDNFFSVQLNNLHPNDDFLADLVPLTDDTVGTKFKLSEWVSDKIEDLLPTVNIYR